MTGGAVLFDIDGTLVDSNYLHTTAWRRAFLEAGCDSPTAWIHRCIGMGSDQLVREIVGPQPDEVLAAVKAAHGRQFEAMRPELRAFAGARDLLGAVHARGCRVVLASSAGPTELPALLEVLGAGESVDIVTGGADVAAAKPEPDVFELAMRRAAVAPGNAVAIGDTVWDVQAAARAGIGCVGVLTGGTSAHELQAAGAMVVYRDVAQLLEALDASPLATLWV